jgi:hypothetical protein
VPHQAWEGKHCARRRGLFALSTTISCVSAPSPHCHSRRFKALVVGVVVEHLHDPIRLVRPGSASILPDSFLRGIALTWTMADRLNQYPMLPPNFNSTLLQQQHPQQAQQQSQADSHPTLQGISNPEHSRMWQVMQQNYRAQNASELAGSQINQQQVSFCT